MVICDLCGAAKKCSSRQIEGKEYDICSVCWEALAGKLRGKGRPVKADEIVLLPSSVPEPDPPNPKTVPEIPPKIWGRLSFSPVP